MRKIKIHSSLDFRLVPFIQRSRICHDSQNCYKRSNSNQNIQNSNTKTFPNYSSDDKKIVLEQIKKEQEILESPLVKSIKRSKLLFDESLDIDDYYSDNLE